ncbi:hypothetical protein BDV36DRAFT_302401 [Aspergillus pseudocaelatus]|uniref:Uncharacterized protein n=1 Tax=Aspergillus pseudocaelatus TaxID=1825620 RepID=A0ABQ6W0Z9_9EURO|nr:hypothetical protein BDV36DRAFT_302401 [Aspergillus pseudocaelatus]
MGPKDKHYISRGSKAVALPLPGIEHGKRILASVVETRARDGPGSTWVSVPIGNEDLSRGFKDISFQQLNNAANHAARWLSEHLPGSSEPFQCFAYAGPKDFRYPILAVAAVKIQKVMVLPSPLVTAEAQLRILEKKKCTVCSATRVPVNRSSTAISYSLLTL